ncbi:hypothetical protein ABTX34_27240 [Streptomyces sp. NPDC096538]|uniref:hypothetical protein n=1 Tax=Streptomyces sp. NPDC096538 TaxID=3155427 RepID=UPI00332D311C
MTGAHDVLNIVFVLVVLFTLVQGPPHPARRRPTPALDPPPGALCDVQVEPPDVLDA